MASLLYCNWHHHYINSLGFIYLLLASVHSRYKLQYYMNDGRMQPQLLPWGPHDFLALMDKDQRIATRIYNISITTEIINIYSIKTEIIYNIFYHN